MSDGAMEGFRQAGSYEERRLRIDLFFRMIVDQIADHWVDLTAARAAFDDFDRIRFAGHIARHRIEKERDKRWETMLAWIKMTGTPIRYESTHTLHYDVNVAWAQILSLALIHASPDVIQALHEGSYYRHHRIALYVPSSGGQSPKLYGSLESVFDCIAVHKDKAHVIQIYHDELAVTSIRTMGRQSEEVKDPQLAKLRFIYV